MKTKDDSTPDELVSLIPPAPFDFTNHVQKATLKQNQICPMVVSYLRKVCKQMHYGEREATVLLTKPCDLHYELFIFRMYRKVMEYL